MSWLSLIVKDLALGVGPHVMWWLLEGIEPSFDACLSPGGRFRRAAEERNGRKNDLLEPKNIREALLCASSSSSSTNKHLKYETQGEVVSLA